MGKPEVHIFFRKLSQILPWAVLILYGRLIYSEYSTKLDRNLIYHSPTSGFAVEDALGFGFWPTWFIMLILVVIANALAYFLGMKRYIIIVIFIVFTVLSAIDYYLYNMLAAQIL